MFSSFVNIDITLGLNTNINLTTIIIKLNFKKVIQTNFV